MRQGAVHCSLPISRRLPGLPEAGVDEEAPSECTYAKVALGGSSPTAQTAALVQIGTPWDEVKCSESISRWEAEWARDAQVYPAQPTGDAVEISRRLLAKYSA